LLGGDKVAGTLDQGGHGGCGGGDGLCRGKLERVGRGTDGRFLRRQRARAGTHVFGDKAGAPGGFRKVGRLLRRKNWRIVANKADTVSSMRLPTLPDESKYEVGQDCNDPICKLKNVPSGREPLTRGLNQEPLSAVSTLTTEHHSRSGHEAYY